jgi:hypothetical protein
MHRSTAYGHTAGTMVFPSMRARPITGKGACSQVNREPLTRIDKTLCYAPSPVSAPARDAKCQGITNLSTSTTR